MASPGGGDALQDAPQTVRRLFLGNLPKTKTDEDIRDEVGRTTRGLVRVIAYKDPADPRLHRGFCFLDYESAEAAAAALRRLARSPVFGCRMVVDWADPEPEAGADVMARVRVLFVRQYGGTRLDEAALKTAFGRHGAVDRVKTLKNYAFVHFARRDDARAAMEALDGATDADTGVRTEVSWARPPPADHSARERMLRDRERRMAQSRPDSGVGLVGQRAPAVGRAYPSDDYDHYVFDFGGRADAVCNCRRPRRGGPATGGYDDDVDDKIRMFFLKLTVGGIRGTPGEQ